MSQFVDLFVAKLTIYVHKNHFDNKINGGDCRLKYHTRI